jgi:hypothetical protein
MYTIRSGGQKQDQKAISGHLSAVGLKKRIAEMEEDKEEVNRELRELTLKLMAVPSRTGNSDKR